MKLTPAQHDRAAGVLLASAAGDALGAGYEFTYPAADVEIAMIGGGPFGFEAGEWTDDTSMAVAVARVTAAGTTCGPRQAWMRWPPGSPSGIPRNPRTSATRPVLSFLPATGRERLCRQPPAASPD